MPGLPSTPPQPQKDYEKYARGRLGQFAVGPWRVGFLLTKARLGERSTDAESRLTEQLKPFREVIPAGALSFGELLQRDLDDHRVAERLIPYVLGGSDTAPVFPPALVMALPFGGKEPAAAVDGPVDENVTFERDQIFYRGTQYGSALRTGEMLVQEDGDHYELGLGTLEWNPEACKLVVLDGQHRLMALLAIQRTIDETWNDSTGSEYAPFYVDRVNHELAARGLQPTDLDGIEMPAMICWFPELLAREHEAIRAARNLFVVVNREARPPSEGRTTLLSETELRHIFTREILERLRPDLEADHPLPLIAIEYDNPDREKARPDRWNAITNINLLSNIVRRCVFGPKQLLTDMTIELPGGPLGRDSSLFMRRQLDVEELYADIELSGSLEATDITNEEFPDNYQPLSDRFWSRVGQATVEVLGRLSPYAAHHSALEHLRKKWMADRNSLWYRALFEGSGLYWSMKKTDESWRRLKKRNTDLAKTEVVAAWEELDRRRALFEAERRSRLPEIPADWALTSEYIYRNTFTTHACQLGTMLTVGAVVEDVGDRHKASEVASQLVRAWNTGLDGASESGEPRMYFMQKGVPRALNRIGTMNTGDAVRFRYFWLELLLTDEAQAELSESVRESVLKLTLSARSSYRQYLIEGAVKALETLYGAEGIVGHLDEAKAAATNNLKAALVHWLALEEESFDSWVEDEDSSSD
jgi:hypothetical protein